MTASAALVRMVVLVSMVSTYIIVTVYSDMKEHIVKQVSYFYLNPKV